MPELTHAEKLAGRRFRDEQQATLDRQNQEAPPDVFPPPQLHHYRHECPARGGTSTSFDMREVYITSPRYDVCTCGEAVSAPEASAGACHHPRPGCRRTEVPAGRLGFIYRAGKCGCGLTGRSRSGRVVDAQERPPMGRS
jgi:hypothetical protein